MKNQSDDILDNLTFVNGKEEVEEITASKKKATKKIALTNICAQVGVPAARRKPQMIQNILNA